MSLRTKTLVIVAAVLCGLLLTFRLVTQRFILDSYHSMEAEELARALERAQDALKARLRDLDKTAADWANWDDTYALVQGKGDLDEMIAQVTPSWAAQSDVQLVAMYRQDGRQLFARAFDLKDGGPAAAPGFFGQPTLPPTGLPCLAAGSSGCTGLLVVPEGILLLAARGGRDSEAKEPPRGLLILGRFLDDDVIQDLSARTGIDLHHLSSDAVQALSDRPADASGPGQTTWSRIRADAWIDGYASLTDLSGQSAGALEVTLPRRVHQHGLLVMRYLLVSMLVVSACFLGLSIFLLNRFVASRLLALIAQVQALGESPDPGGRVRLVGNDELSLLARTLNHLLEALGRSSGALLESERCLSTLLSNIPGMAYRCANTPAWEMAFVSDGCLALTGYPAALLMGGGLPYSELIHPEDREAVWRGVQAALETRAPFQLSYRLRHASGELRWVWEQGRGIFDARGELLALEGLVMDVSERRRAQLELQEAKEAAETANLAKSAFLANMSHEIRTPLAAILGYTEELLGQSHSCLGATETLSAVQRNGQHLLELINDILDLSKIEAGQMAVERVRCTLRPLLGEILGLLGSRAERRGLSLTILQDGLLPAWLETDPTRLKQVLTNLLGNAVKFTEKGSVRLTVSWQAAQGLLQLDVQDTGMGMTADVVACLFKPFTQGDSSMARRFGGTGLGLTISQRLCRLLGGELCLVSSQPGQGSHFRATCRPQAAGPLVDRESLELASLPTSSSPIQVLGPYRLLLAEDGPDNQRLLSRLLERAGAQVTLAADGAVAVEAVARAAEAGLPFDLVLMDMQMPVMDGYAATRILRDRGYTGPIVALTAHAMAGDREQCLQAGCDDYLSKPVTRASLVGTLARLLASRGIESHAVV